MKNVKLLLLGILAIGLAVFSGPTKAQAQRNTFPLRAFTQAGVFKSTPDTTANTDTTYLYFGDASGNLTPFNQYEDLIYYWSAIPSITGTTTTGTLLYAEGSMTGTVNRWHSGTDWVNLISDASQSTVTSSGATQTTVTYPITISGSTAIYGYLFLPKVQMRYVRLVLVTAGTQTSVLTGRASVLPHG
jgi:hypothetical protein